MNILYNETIYWVSVSTAPMYIETAITRKIL